MPVIHDGKTYYTPEELDAHMTVFIQEQSDILRKELRAIREKRGTVQTQQELVLL
jgi:hypothetical protein